VIEKYISCFKKSEQKSNLSHLKTRRLGAAALFLGALGLIITLVDIFWNRSGALLPGFIPNFEKYAVVTFFIFSIGYVVAIVQCKTKENLECMIKILYLSHAIFLVLNNSFISGPVLAGTDLLIYFGCYYLNRQQGFTRSWSRYQRVVTQLKLLKWNVEEDIKGTEDLYIARKEQQQEVILSKARVKLSDILEKHAFERQTDIVGDYLSTNDAAFSWIKSLKK